MLCLAVADVENPESPGSSKKSTASLISLVTRLQGASLNSGHFFCQVPVLWVNWLPAKRTRRCWKRSMNKQRPPRELLCHTVSIVEGSKAKAEQNRTPCRCREAWGGKCLREVTGPKV